MVMGGPFKEIGAIFALLIVFVLLVSPERGSQSAGQGLGINETKLGFRTQKKRGKPAVNLLLMVCR